MSKNKSRSLTDKLVKESKDLRSQGHTYHLIAGRLNSSYGVVYRALKETREEQSQPKMHPALMMMVAA